MYTKFRMALWLHLRATFCFLEELFSAPRRWTKALQSGGKEGTDREVNVCNDLRLWILHGRHREATREKYSLWIPWQNKSKSDGQEKNGRKDEEPKKKGLIVS